MAPAIALARDGFVLSRDDTELLDAKADRFAQDPAAAKIFLRPDGSRFMPGDRLVQKDLAATLAAIAEKGPDAFYKGTAAAAVDKASRANGGILTARDFADYTDDRGAAALLLLPRLCDRVGAAAEFGRRHDLRNPGHPRRLRHEGARPALGALGGADGRGDAPRLRRPQRLSRRPGLCRRTRSTACCQRAMPPGSAPRSAAGEAPPSAPLAAPHEKAETTHYSVVDGAGNAVAVTYTINGYFGAEVIAPGTGFFLNNEMDDFTAKPGTPNLYGLVQGEANAIAPGKRPLSSMAPTLVEKDGRVFLVLGSPGGSRIITAVLETIMNIVDYGMAPQAAVDAPRFHYQGLPDKVFYERSALSPDTIATLRGKGDEPRRAEALGRGRADRDRRWPALGCQ